MVYCTSRVRTAATQVSFSMAVSGCTATVE